MFHAMRRNGQQLCEEEILALINGCTSGVLAVAGDDDYPYAVPLSYAYADGKLYFHCAKAGHKLDAITRNEKVSFCVIAEDNVHPEKITTYYKSVIAFGRAHIVQEPEEKRKALMLLSEKYLPEYPELRDRVIEETLERVCILKMEIEHMTGKQAIELVKGD